MQGYQLLEWSGIQEPVWCDPQKDFDVSATSEVPALPEQREFVGFLGRLGDDEMTTAGNSACNKKRLEISPAAAEFTLTKTERHGKIRRLYDRGGYSAIFIIMVTIA